MKKILCLCFCLLPLLFTSCVTLDVISTVISVSQEIDEINDKSDKEKKVSNSIYKNEKVEKYGAFVKSTTAVIKGITPEDEYIIGRAVASSVLGQYKLYNNEKATEYVNKICSALVMNSYVPYLYKGYYVAILDTAEVNALSTPGGHIFVTRGLIECAESEDALAAVIAHEISHIQLSHAMISIKTNRGVDVFTQMLNIMQEENSKLSDKDLKIFDETRTSMFTTLMNTGFSKSMEFEADEYAMNLMADSGFDPACMIDLLTILENHTSGYGWSKTHPKPESRIKTAKSNNKIKKFKGASAKVRQARFDSVKENF